MSKKTAVNTDGFPNTDITIHSAPTLTIGADIDRVLEILRSLPMLRRYGGDGEALNEAREILEKVREIL